MSSRPLAAALVAALVLATSPGAARAKPLQGAPAQRAGAGLNVPRFGKELATRLRAPKTQTHATDFSNETMGCIAFTTRDMRHLGYRGHALVCEEAYTNRVLGALMDSKGRVRCAVDGTGFEEGCYDLFICDELVSLCL
jgi:hypothetical protein